MYQLCASVSNYVPFREDIEQWKTVAGGGWGGEETR